ncbi:hypothetical protein [Mucilaginibacter sp.]|uniref:hypothetical protein n=1 Tax=Mucilaginibacter sp. TaxID=1882438 RepID=UPI00284BAE33|nr:hypothetical protein [Mucilaginibacter sp.]MDR3693724.1 hypothetical protein [Mucilaginibacter sp.]
MSADFFKPECRRVTIETIFGICDDTNEMPAYLDSVNKSIWIATVNNNSQKEITFTAVDNCIEILRENGEMENRCDVMLTSDICLYLVELKNKVSDWRSEGIDQLEATIKVLKNTKGDFYFSFRKRKAFVANRRHPHFVRSNTDDMERFRDVHRIRLYLQATISI